MQALVGGAILVAISAMPSQDHGFLSPPIGIPGPITTILKTVADFNSAGAIPVAELTVATLNNTPLVTVFANGVPLVLVLDTGAERTVVTPAAAKRISGKTPRIEFHRGLRGIAGSLPTQEIELDSFSIGGAPIPWKRVSVASITTPQVFSIALDGFTRR